MNRIIFATGNAGKMVEVREILAGVDAEVLSMKEAGIKADIVEDGSTFEENALIKARAIHAQCGCLVLADDSGLEVDAMDKAPGIYSARFMGEDTSYEIKNQAIIDRLAGLALRHCGGIPRWYGSCHRRNHRRRDRACAQRKRRLRL